MRWLSGSVAVKMAAGVSQYVPKGSAYDMVEVIGVLSLDVLRALRHQLTSASDMVGVNAVLSLVVLWALNHQLTSASGMVEVHVVVNQAVQ